MNRQATFSSSQIWKLMTSDKKGGFGAPAKKYIKQVKYEMLLGRSINTEATAKATSWGILLESRVFELLGLEYQLVSRERLVNPAIAQHTGMPDIITDTKVGDIKCPFSLEVFCDKLEALKSIDTYREEFPEDYWQLVSNAILTNKRIIEPIIYVPYQSELAEIREQAEANKLNWISYATDYELPYLIDGGNFKNINLFQFEVPDSDIVALTERINQAVQLLF